MSNFSERLRELRNSRKLSQQNLADELKISKSSVNMYERGEREPGIETLENIADFFNVDMDFLIGKTDVANRAINGFAEKSNISAVIPNGNIYQIPVFDSVSAGFGAYASDEIIDYIPAVIMNESDVDDTIAIHVSGDSMYPKIEDGDTIVVRKQTSVDSGSIAVVLLDGEEGLVKKVNYGDDWIELVSLNPEYQTRRFEGEEVLRIQVVGLVKQIVKTL